MMKYKTYIGHIEYDDKAKIFHGEVIGLKDVITFQGTNVEEIEQSFKDSIDDYIAFCKKRGEKPEKPFSGTFNVRISPDLHAKLVLNAQIMGVSLNNYVKHTLTQVVHTSMQM